MAHAANGRNQRGAWHFLAIQPKAFHTLIANAHQQMLPHMCGTLKLFTTEVRAICN